MKLEEYIKSNDVYDNLLESIEIERKILEDKKNQLKRIKHKILEEKILQYEALSKYSTFKGDSIGMAMAKFLTTIRNEDYIYMTCKLVARKYCGYDYDSKQKEYKLEEIPVRIIVPLKRSLEFSGSIDIEDFRKLIDDDIIIVDRNEHNKMDENINMYDNDFNFSLNSPFFDEGAIHYFEMPKTADYDLLKDFVDRVIDYRIENFDLDISDDKLYELLEEKPTIKDEDLRRQRLVSSILIEETGCYKNDKVLKKEKR